LYAYVKSMIPS